MTFPFIMYKHPYPLLTHTFIEYIISQDIEDKILLEIGSGDSTLYWENKFKKVISYENDLNYHHQILNSKKQSSTEIYLFNKTIFEDKNFLQNVKLADYIIIDNDAYFISRYDFSVFCKNNMKPNSTIVLDNGLWGCNLKSYTYLMENFFAKDFPGTNKNNEITVTTIFNTFREKKYFNYTKTSWHYFNNTKNQIKP